tara:strand:+ start:248 stop:793 length:546 start_codon:yes stop_codon:yes gene_type:complete
MTKLETIKKNLTEWSLLNGKLKEKASHVKNSQNEIVVKTLANFVMANKLLSKTDFKNLKNELVENKSYSVNTVDVYCSCANKLITNTKLWTQTDWGFLKDIKEHDVQQKYLVEIVKSENLTNFSSVRNYQKAEAKLSDVAEALAKEYFKLANEAGLVEENEQEKVQEWLRKVADKIYKLGA